MSKIILFDNPMVLEWLNQPYTFLNPDITESSETAFFRGSWQCLAQPVGLPNLLINSLFPLIQL
jgi:hypothetical protein